MSQWEFLYVPLELNFQIIAKLLAGYVPTLSLDKKQLNVPKIARSYVITVSLHFIDCPLENNLVCSRQQVTCREKTWRKTHILSCVITVSA